VFNFTVGFTTSITASLQIKNVSCNGGNDAAITVTGAGGASPYSYALGTGAFGASNSFTGLTAGSYTVHVRDNNGCLLDSTVNITEPTPLNIDVTNIVNAACFNSSDGSITINVTGGTAPYTYAWSGGVTATTNPTNLAGGTYTVTVTDANGCAATKDIVVGQTPRIFIGIASTQNVSCSGGNDGYIDITVNGGTPPYNYLWSNASTNEDQTNLTAGTYTVTVTDGNGCSLDTTVTLTSPPAITGTLTATSNNVCAGSTDGTATVHGSGGVPPYTYSINGVAFQSDTLFTGLGAGNYAAVIKDATGCSFTTNSITITSGAALSVSYQDAQITLGDSILLEAMLTPTTFRVSQVTWTPTDGLACPTCLNTEAGPRQTTTYNVVVTDSGGCSASTNVTVTVDENFRVMVPNVFSPNGDGNNDYFSFYAFGTEKIEVHIFNRWGSLVYYNPNQLPRANGWDGNFKGKEAQSGTYVYVLDILFANGEQRQQTGSITLLR
jgi:gliding motility-associated-like protein